MEEKLLNKIDYLLTNIEKPKKQKKTKRYDLSKLKPKDGDQVTVNYIGKLLNGKEFDNSWKKDKPFKFIVGKKQVIKGWDRVIKRMHIGQRLRVRIPSELAYGSKGIGSIIPPNSDLIFVIKLLKINNIE